jgi:membrane protein
VLKIERIIVTWWPIAFIIRKSKVTYIPGFQKIPLYNVVQFFIKQVQKVGLNERAAAISFNLIMALPAALLFLFSIIPYLPGSEFFEIQVLTFFKDLSPNSSTYSFIRNILKDLLEKSVGVFSFGFLLVMFYASNAMMGIIRTFDKSIKENKDYFFNQRWRALQLTFIIILLFIISSTLLIGQNQLAIIVKKLFHLKKKTTLPWWNAVRWITLLAFQFYGIAFIYKFAPSVKKRWPIVSPGAVLTTVLVLVTTAVFGFWVNNFASYNKVYGSIGTVLIIMLLIYINSLILLIGFELNVSIFSNKDKLGTQLNAIKTTT